MKISTYSQVRNLWNRYWQHQNYFLVRNKNIISEDKSLLFVNSGISAIKKYFLEQDNLPSSYLYNIQACLRLNDLHHIGVTNWHNSFFEMLGHFSIGQCDKQSVIKQAVNFLCGKNWMHFDINKIYVTVYQDDVETYLIWQKYIPESHIVKNNHKHNFWQIGKGPCGPNTEIFYKLTDSNSDDDNSFYLLKNNIDNDIYLELWNIVFSEFNYLGNEKYEKLDHKSVDVGAGLERILIVLEHKKNIFETSLFEPLVCKLKRRCKSITTKQIKNLYRICDFLRTIIFLIANKVSISNKFHGSVLKKVIRLLLLETNSIELPLEDLTVGTQYFIDYYSEYYPELSNINQSAWKVIMNHIKIKNTQFYQWHAFYRSILKQKNRQVKYLSLFENPKIQHYFFSNVKNLLYPADRFQKYSTYGSWQPEFLNQYKVVLKFLSIKYYSSYQYSILMPPPNITGELHLGHLYELFIQDTLIREKKLMGFNTIWFAGYDHGGISTQIKISRYFEENNQNITNNQQLNFNECAQQWKVQTQDKIFRQWKKCGLLIDPKITNYTLDTNATDIANYVFNLLFVKKYIYRSNRIVNYDPVLDTVISDVEVGHRKYTGYLYYVKYRLADSEKVYLVATSRPETIFADEYIAINPQDARVTKLQNKYLINPLTGARLPIILDQIVDLKFGSGLLKVTPGHDFNDFNIGKKIKNTKFLQVINKAGMMINVPQPFNRMPYLKCRQSIIKHLSSKSKIAKKVEYMATTNYNLKNNIDVVPLLSSQWFLALGKIAQKFLKTFTTDDVLQLPINFLPLKTNTLVEKILNNTADWCISRQIQWGHKIPIAYRIGSKNQDFICTVNSSKYTDSEYIMESSVFDTWFTSCLWPLISTKFRTDSEFFVKTYPLSLLTTGYDILFIWVVRMMLMCFIVAELHNKTVAVEEKKLPLIPIRTVHIHGLIRDIHNLKMSKSNNNGIEPLEVIDIYGNDAVRLFFLLEHKQIHDIKFVPAKIQHWNAHLLKINSIGIFLEKQLKNNTAIHNISDTKSTDEWLITNYFFTQFKDFISELDQHEYKFLNAEKRVLNSTKYHKIIQFIIKKYSGSMLEQAKFYLSDDRSNTSALEKQKLIEILCLIFSELLILLNPVCPFVSEYWFKKLNNHAIYQFKSVLYPVRFYDLMFYKYQNFNTKKIVTREWRIVHVNDSLDNPENLCIIASLKKHLPQLDQSIFYRCSSTHALDVEIKTFFRSILFAKKLLSKTANITITSDWINYDEWDSLQKVAISHSQNIESKKQNAGIYCEYELLLPKNKVVLIYNDILLAIKKMKTEQLFLENKVKVLENNVRLIKNDVSQRFILQDKISNFIKKKQLITKTLSALLNNNLVRKKSPD